MSKTWEVDFTSFSGVSNVAYDNVGTQHLTASSGIIKVSPLENYVFRPGVSFPNDGTLQKYGFRASGASNTYIQASFTARSWVFDFFVKGRTDNTTYWDSGGAVRRGIFSEASSAPVFQSGLSHSIAADTDAIPFGITWRNSTTTGDVIDFGILNEGWYQVVVSINRAITETKVYLNGSLIGTLASVPSATAPTGDLLLGDITASEGTFQFGRVSVYNTILTSGEVTALYGTGLVDAVSGTTAFQSLSGTLYGLNGSVVSGASIYAIYTPTAQIVTSGTTDGIGFYNINLPYSGSYSLLFTSAPASGTRSISIIATSGGVDIL